MNLISNRRFWIHLLFWAALLILLFILNRNRFDNADVILVPLINVGILSAVFYANYLWISNFYVDRRYVAYYGLIAVLLVSGGLFFYVTQEAFPSNFERRIRAEQQMRNEQREAAPPQIESESRPPNESRDAEPRRRRSSRRTFFYMFPASMLLLLTWAISSFVRTGDEARKKEKEVALLRAEQADTELKLLKSQINPHFLFNALNNIYSLTVTKSTHAPDMLLKLSSMLRYVLYEGNDDSVPLASEIKYIKDYITLQKLKDEDISNIEFTNEGDIDYLIPPMLLIPFVENAFKHSKVEDLVNGWIKIQLKVQGKQLLFQVENSLPTEVATDETGGIGIDNVKRRLELLYGAQSSLTINKTEDSFEVQLNIPLD